MRTQVLRWALAAATLFATVPAPAQPVPAEVFFRRPAVAQQMLSPSGRRLAITTEIKGRVGLFIVDLQSADLKATRVALFSDLDVDRFQWLDDERLLFDFVDNQAGSAEDYRVAPGLMVARFDGTEERLLIERQGVPIIREAGRDKVLPRTHALLHVPVLPEERAGEAADEVIVGESRFIGGVRVAVDPKWLNVRTGRVRRVDVLGAPAGTIRWWFSPTGEPRAALSRERDRDALHWSRASSGEGAARWVKLAEAPSNRLPFVPVWVGDGDRLYVAHRAGPAGESVAAPFDFAKGQPGEALVRVAGFDFEGRLIGDPEGRRLLGVRIESDAELAIWWDPARKALQQRVDQALPGRVNRIECRRCGASDAVALVRSWSDRHPGQLLLWQAVPGDDKGRWRVVAEVQPGIDPQRMGQKDLVRIRTRDGRDLPVWITKPAGARPGQALHAVVMVHDGPWTRHGHWRWDPMAQFLASRGWLVIEPEMRGSRGYGWEHFKAGFKQWGQAMQDDVADALLWARAQGMASDKACIVGGGYGGYSTLMGLVRQPELYRCGSAWFALADPLLFVEGGFFVNDNVSWFAREHTLPELVGDPRQDRAMLLANSPVALADRLRAPLQLIWGEDDLLAPIAHGKRLRSAMRDAGLEPEWIVYEGEGHGLRKLENRVDMAKKLEAFLSRHLQ